MKTRYTHQPKKELPDQVPVVPCETLEQANERWEDEMVNMWGISLEDMETFKRVRSRAQFLDHMNMFNISYQTDLNFKVPGRKIF